MFRSALRVLAVVAAVAVAATWSEGSEGPPAAVGVPGAQTQPAGPGQEIDPAGPSPTTDPASPVPSDGAAPPEPETPAASTLGQAGATALAVDAVAALSQRSTADDPRYYQDGLWLSGLDTCWRCHLGPAVLAATLGARGGSAASRTLAIDSFDRAIAEQRHPDGSFGPATPATSRDIDTMFFANDLGAAYLELEPYLGAERAARWREAVGGAASFLVTNGNLRWYTNGNINLGNALAFAYAFRVTGAATYAQSYETALAFALSPPQGRWPGFGLQYSRLPTQPDGSDGAGYLAESGGGTPGYDADYTQLQADLSTRLYLLNGDARALRLMNLFTNQLLASVDQVAWTLDTGGGTRRADIGRRIGFTTPALTVLATLGGRTDLAPLAAAQWPASERSWRGAFGYSNPGMYVAFGNQVAQLYMALVPRATAGDGYWVVTETGDVHAFGSAPYLAARAQGSGIVDLEATPTGAGYWVLAADGSVTPSGDAVSAGDAVGAMQAGERAISLSADPLGRGYWIFTDRGRVLARGGAPFFGDMAAVALNGPVVDSVATPTGAGYYLAASDGGIFSFGDAAFHGSVGGLPLNAPVRAIVPDPDGGGYWLAASDGGVFAFNAGFRGSMGGVALSRPVVGMVAYGTGYLMVAGDGGVFVFSDKPFLGSLGDHPPAGAVVSVASSAVA